LSIKKSDVLGSEDVKTELLETLQKNRKSAEIKPIKLSLYLLAKLWLGTFPSLSVISRSKDSAKKQRGSQKSTP
jgi:hypothetical protein